MAENAGNTDGDEPSWDDEEDGVAESTVAMAAPVFPSGMPSPISAPPSGPDSISPQLSMPTAPTAFKPEPPPSAGPPPSPLGFGPLTMQSPQGAARPPSSVGMPPLIEAPPVPPPLPADPSALIRRSHTVIGVAPPATGAQRPPTSPGGALRPPTAPTALAPRPIPGAGDTAKHAPAHDPMVTPVAPPVKAIERPVSSPRPAAPVQAKDVPDETETFPAAPRSSDALPAMRGDSDEPDEPPTRAVPREQLVQSSPQLVVGNDDGSGEDATLAVAPANNRASSSHFAAFATTMQAEDGGGFPPSYRQQAAPPQPGFPPPPQQQGWGQPQQPYPPNAMSAPPYPSGLPRMGSDPHLPVMGHASPNAPMLAAQPPPGQPMYAPIANPPAAYAQPSGRASGWDINLGSTKFRLSKQILLLVVVGIFCLSIFVTGLVLFATTNF